MNYRNQKILKAMRKLPCANCGAEDGTVAAAHANWGFFGKGKSLKAHDCFVAPLCHKCHMDLDQGKTMTHDQRVEFWEEAFFNGQRMAWERGLFTVDDEALK